MGKKSILKKVDDRLYIEPCKREDGTDFEVKWKKELEPVWLDLKETRLMHAFEVSHPIFEFRLGRLEEKAGDKLQYESYERREKRHIEATGKLTTRASWRGDSIGIIARDGSTQHRVFTEVKVSIRRLDGDLTQADVEQKKVNGFMGHLGEDACVYLDLHVPSDIFDNAYRELQEARDKEVSLCVYADVFNSEVDRGLRDHREPRDFFIEEESGFNHLYLHHLIISERVSNSADKEISSERNNSEGADDPNKRSSQLFAAIANNIAQIRFVIIVILILFVVRMFIP